VHLDLPRALAPEEARIRGELAADDRESDFLCHTSSILFSSSPTRSSVLPSLCRSLSPVIAPTACLARPLARFAFPLISISSVRYLLCPVLLPPYGGEVRVSGRTALSEPAGRTCGRRHGSAVTASSAPRSITCPRRARRVGSRLGRSNTDVDGAQGPSHCSPRRSSVHDRLLPSVRVPHDVPSRGVVDRRRTRSPTWSPT
jgi:hypothetical protein